MSTIEESDITSKNPIKNVCDKNSKTVGVLVQNDQNLNSCEVDSPNANVTENLIDSEQHTSNKKNDSSMIDERSSEKLVSGLVEVRNNSRSTITSNSSDFEYPPENISIPTADELKNADINTPLLKDMLKSTDEEDIGQPIRSSSKMKSDKHPYENISSKNNIFKALYDGHGDDGNFNGDSRLHNDYENKADLSTSSLNTSKKNESVHTYHDNKVMENSSHKVPSHVDNPILSSHPLPPVLPHNSSDKSNRFSSKNIFKIDSSSSSSMDGKSHEDNNRFPTELSESSSMMSSSDGQQHRNSLSLPHDSVAGGILDFTNNLDIEQPPPSLQKRSTIPAAKGPPRKIKLEFNQAMSDFRTMFPTIDDQVIETVLRSNRGEVDATIDQLLTLSADTSTSPLTNESSFSKESTISKPTRGILEQTSVPSGIRAEFHDNTVNPSSEHSHHFASQNGDYGLSNQMQMASSSLHSRSTETQSFSQPVLGLPGTLPSLNFQSKSKPISTVMNSYTSNGSLHHSHQARYNTAADIISNNNSFTSSPHTSTAVLPSSNNNTFNDDYNSSNDGSYCRHSHHHHRHHETAVRKSHHSRWNPILMSDLPSDFLRINVTAHMSSSSSLHRHNNENTTRVGSIHERQHHNKHRHRHRHHHRDGYHRNHNINHSNSNNHGFTRHRMARSNMYDSEAIQILLHKNAVKLHEAQIVGNIKLEQLLHDERFALMLQNHEFIQELQANSEFMEHLHRDQQMMSSKHGVNNHLVGKHHHCTRQHCTQHNMPSNFPSITGKTSSGESVRSPAISDASLHTNIDNVQSSHRLIKNFHGANVLPQSSSVDSSMKINTNVFNNNVTLGGDRLPRDGSTVEIGLPKSSIPIESNSSPGDNEVIPPTDASPDFREQLRHMGQATRAKFLELAHRFFPNASATLRKRSLMGLRGQIGNYSDGSVRASTMNLISSDSDEDDSILQLDDDAKTYGLPSDDLAALHHDNYHDDDDTTMIGLYNESKPSSATTNEVPFDNSPLSSMRNSSLLSSSSWRHTRQRGGSSTHFKGGKLEIDADGFDRDGNYRVRDFGNYDDAEKFQRTQHHRFNTTTTATNTAGFGDLISSHLPSNYNNGSYSPLKNEESIMAISDTSRFSSSQSSNSKNIGGNRTLSDDAGDDNTLRREMAKN